MPSRLLLRTGDTSPQPASTQASIDPPMMSPSPKRSYREKQTKSIIGTGRKRVDVLGVKPVRVVANFFGDFGGKFDSFGETGNKTTRVNVQVKSTGIEYPVDGIIDNTQDAANSGPLVVEPMFDEMQMGTAHAVYVLGNYPSKTTAAVFSGNEQKLGLAYHLLDALHDKSKNAIINVIGEDENVLAELTLMVYEVHNNNKVVDLLVANPDSSPPTIQPPQPGDLELRIEGLTERTIHSMEDGTAAIHDAIQRRCDVEIAKTAPHTVVHFRMAYQTLSGMRSHSDYYVIEVHPDDKSALLQVMEAMADGGLGLTPRVYTTPGIRLVLPRLLESCRPDVCTLVACMSGGMSNKPDAIATLKSLRSAFELRVENKELSDLLSNSPTATVATASVASRSPVTTPLHAPEMPLGPGGRSGVHGQSFHEQEIRYRQLEGKLEAKKKQLFRMQEMLTAKDSEVQREVQRRVEAEERAQDAENAAEVVQAHTVNIQRIQQEALEISQTNEALRQKIRTEETQRTQDMQQATQQLETVSADKVAAERSLAALKGRLTTLAVGAEEMRPADVMAELRKLAGVPEPEPRANGVEEDASGLRDDVKEIVRMPPASSAPTDGRRSGTSQRSFQRPSGGTAFGRSATTLGQQVPAAGVRAAMRSTRLGERPAAYIRSGSGGGGGPATTRSRSNGGQQPTSYSRSATTAQHYRVRARAF